LAGGSKVRSYEPRQMVFLQGERADGFFVIIEGRLEVFRSDRSDLSAREQVLHRFEDGDIVGEVPLFSGGCYPAGARANSPLTMLYIPGDVFLDTAMSNPDMLLEMLAVLSSRLRRFTDLIADLSMKDVATRVAEYLLSLPRAKSAGDADVVEFPMGKREIAGQLGTIPETLSRALSRLRSAGVIEIEGRSVVILDRRSLESFGAPE